MTNREKLTREKENYVMGEKCAKAYRMRRAGRTYVFIGKQLAVSGNRASQLVKKAERRLEDYYSNPFWGLSERLQDVIAREFECASKEDLVDAIKRDPLKMFKLAGYREHAHGEVCKWLNIDEAITRGKLARRCIEYLEQYGCKIVYPENGANPADQTRDGGAP